MLWAVLQQQSGYRFHGNAFSEPLQRNCHLFIRILPSNGRIHPFRGLCPATDLCAIIYLYYYIIISRIVISVLLLLLRYRITTLLLHIYSMLYCRDTKNTFSHFYYHYYIIRVLHLYINIRHIVSYFVKPILL
jgi:hypothetical protein